MMLIRKATCTFEPIDATQLRLVVIEHEDIENGGNQVIEIAVVDLSDPRSRVMATLTRFSRESGLPFELAFKAYWPAEIGLARTLEGRIGKILDAYPGAAECRESLALIGPDHAVEADQPF